MVNVIDELLLLAKVNQTEVKVEPLNMRGIVAEAQRRLKHLIEQYRSEIIEPTDWPVALGYAPWAEEVWVNYLSNAIKYGGRPPRRWRWEGNNTNRRHGMLLGTRQWLRS